MPPLGVVTISCAADFVSFVLQRADGPDSRLVRLDRPFVGRRRTRLNARSRARDPLNENAKMREIWGGRRPTWDGRRELWGGQREIWGGRRPTWDSQREIWSGLVFDHYDMWAVVHPV
jgi:hypothetical protein